MCVIILIIDRDNDRYFYHYLNKSLKILLVILRIDKGTCIGYTEARKRNPNTNNREEDGEERTDSNGIW